MGKKRKQTETESLVKAEIDKVTDRMNLLCPFCKIDGGMFMSGAGNLVCNICKSEFILHAEKVEHDAL